MSLSRIKLCSDPAARLNVPAGHVAAKLVWSHILEADDAVDLRDGGTRMAGSNAVAYADGRTPHPGCDGDALRRGLGGATGDAAGLPGVQEGVPAAARDDVAGAVA